MPTIIELYPYVPRRKGWASPSWDFTPPPARDHGDCYAYKDLPPKKFELPDKYRVGESAMLETLIYDKHDRPHSVGMPVRGRARLWDEMNDEWCDWLKPADL